VLAELALADRVALGEDRGERPPKDALGGGARDNGPCRAPGEQPLDGERARELHVDRCVEQDDAADAGGEVLTGEQLLRDRRTVVVRDDSGLFDPEAPPESLHEICLLDDGVAMSARLLGVAEATIAGHGPAPAGRTSSAGTPSIWTLSALGSRVTARTAAASSGGSRMTESKTIVRAAARSRAGRSLPAAAVGCASSPGDTLSSPAPQPCRHETRSSHVIVGFLRPRFKSSTHNPCSSAQLEEVDRSTAS
jgi:hypothetical protein